MEELLSRLDEKPKVTVTYFIADERKEDGTKIVRKDIIEINKFI